LSLSNFIIIFVQRLTFYGRRFTWNFFIWGKLAYYSFSLTTVATMTLVTWVAWEGEVLEAWTQILVVVMERTTLAMMLRWVTNGRHCHRHAHILIRLAMLPDRGRDKSSRRSIVVTIFIMKVFSSCVWTIKQFYY